MAQCVVARIILYIVVVSESRHSSRHRLRGRPYEHEQGMQWMLPSAFLLGCNWYLFNMWQVW